jgi:hypothetical protein
MVGLGSHKRPDAFTFLLLRCDDKNVAFYWSCVIVFSLQALYVLEPSLTRPCKDARNTLPIELFSISAHAPDGQAVRLLK